MRAADALRAAVPRLAAAGIDEAARDARRLLAHAMAIDPARLTLHLPDPLPPEAAARFEAALAARAARQPVGQIVGERLFWGRRFRVTRDTLDPRPETEGLIEAALAEPFATVLDLGTGTGCIAVTLLAERPAAHGIATDLSPAALAVAAENAAALGVASRLELRLSDWFAAVPERVDLILSNPPYIAADEMAALAPEVRLWEPHLALSPGGDGLDAYRAIARGAPAHLRPGGRLLLEIGAAQGRAVAGLVEAAGLARVSVLPDLDGRDRLVSARLPAA
ncbi:peptide chain release factor N(5)-glutamine methyltransferase [Rhodobacter sphaeroides]|uniref:Release factor glutamine methyltransferase n=1 Tax=Cereibacter sphaeroides (strain ATCC 17023 / DSM 158 / JCM 6121 / CCUG 31486 / LMG 2827 / NBRC 12203 / NCIMB 8253 / ATH 2.4.1.) TaxID=272943 RepID=PRMC_CERS4|nr:peptide chain release factor N(5)-glutamine methyltransferase [Cereibacter sphaeroides]Q3J2B7.1 RecName: Full=Release factor glutamine methyltransferase; Short=RF MTase; AltName: Full=N5-glutamine methyltransferase PrmC; AltName: Full=Protein-(glutamine-N5) MTase PrmC; AltName: Full=Protein-glutamine N-methyltransferase PrmC [Cereibacter sphaeroides 2.4.1]ABA79067.1 (protein release factor)-glutamine N5-methyltransferase [Cereibacter sphaeroides 2.4.1]AMJ47386.1 protein-(glutamine-N5) methylt